VHYKDILIIHITQHKEMGRKNLLLCW